MNLPSRGERESATTTRYVGAFVLPVRRRRMCTAKVRRSSVKDVRGRNTSIQATRGSAAWARSVRQAGDPRQLATLGHRAELLHEVLHLLELLQQRVDLGHGDAGAVRDTLESGAIQARGVLALLHRHGGDNRLDRLHLALSLL